jgi:hypothetical protein
MREEDNPDRPGMVTRSSSKRTAETAAQGRPTKRQRGGGSSAAVPNQPSGRGRGRGAGSGAAAPNQPPGRGRGRGAGRGGAPAEPGVAADDDIRTRLTRLEEMIGTLTERLERQPSPVRDQPPPRPEPGPAAQRDAAPGTRTYPVPDDEQYLNVGEDGRPLDKKYWSRSHIGVRNFPDGNQEMIKQLYRNGVRRDFDDGRYTVPPRTDLRPLAGHINPDIPISREPSPDRESVHYDERVYYAVPRTGTRDMERLGGVRENRRGSAWENREGLGGYQFLYYVEGRDVDRTRFDAYPQVDVDRGIVLEPSAQRSTQMDRKLTTRDRHNVR